MNRNDKIFVTYKVKNGKIEPIDRSGIDRIKNKEIRDFAEHTANSIMEASTGTYWLTIY